MGSASGNSVPGDSIALMAENHCSKGRKVFLLSSGKKNIIISWERQTSNQTIIIQCVKSL